MPPLFPPRRASELAILPIVRDRGCQSLADDPVRTVEVRLPAGLCTSTVGSDIEVQHLRRNIGPVMAIALSVEQSRIGQRVDAVVTGHGGAVRRPFRDAGTATVQIICCHSIQSEERRVGKEGVSTCSTRWATYPKQKQKT